MKVSMDPPTGVVINSDHDFVLCNLILKILSQKTKCSNRCRFNLDKLKDESVEISMNNNYINSHN